MADNVENKGQEKDDIPVNEKILATDKETLKHKYQDLTVDELKLLLDNDEISKNQKKKISKQIKWVENAGNRREQRKLRKKLKPKKRNLNSEENKANNKSPIIKKQKKSKISTEENFSSHNHIAIDLNFEEYMTNDDLNKVRRQIAWCYKENRQSSNPVQYYLCGLGERTKSRMDDSHEKWDVHFRSNLYDNFPKEQIIYLTAESDTVLENINAGMVYVIGGLVDHNLHKGLCQKLATERGVKTARLPLNEHVDMKTRKVLTINHVFEILLKYIEVKDWKRAILDIIPERKGAKLIVPTDKAEKRLSS